jgi:hypothetical protein
VADSSMPAGIPADPEESEPAIPLRPYYPDYTGLFS